MVCHLKLITLLCEYDFKSIDNNQVKIMQQPQQYFLNDNGIFPNNILPVLYYPNALRLPSLFSSRYAKNIFEKNGWSNTWRNGIYTYHHYHSVTHEAMAIIRGKTRIQLGGDDGVELTVQKGDVLIIPAGVAHKNLGNEKDAIAIGGYPRGKDYDMNYGKPGERPGTDNKIKKLSVPSTDPLLGKANGVPKIWKPARQKRVGKKNG
jgi:uncharacterized protein YjlB